MNADKASLDPLTSLHAASLLGTRVTASSFESTRSFLSDLVNRRCRGFVSCANAYSVMLAHDDPSYRDILNRAHCVTADGMAVVWALGALGHRAERVHNDDLFLSCCEHYPDWSHFLLGGGLGQPERVVDEMKRRFPGIRIVGAEATPVRPVPPAERARILRAIDAARPSVVWVGMGTPAQDLWMAEAAPNVAAPMVGVGSLFDLLAGKTRPTPGWMKRAGLQWLYRLFQEPRRLGRRYLVYNPRFVVAALQQILRGGCE